jgi:hypothetical protein
MIIAGLLSSKNEAEEIQYIAKIFTVKNRVRFIVRKQWINEILDKEGEKNK